MALWRRQAGDPTNGAAGLERLLAGLDRDQHEAATAPPGPLLVVAGAGAGKTRILIARAAFAVERTGIAPQGILAIAFTNKACGEIAARLRALLRDRGTGIEVRTFHSAAWRLVVRPYSELLGRFAEASILNHADSVRLARQAIAELAAEPGGRRYRGLEPRETYGRIAYAKAHLQRPGDVERDGAPGPLLAAVWRRYSRLARAASAFDFEDMLAAACHLLAEDETIRSGLHNRFGLLLLDEFQDASPAQRRLVELIAGVGGNLTVAGDISQAIYSFRGGDAAGLLRFAETHPGTRTVLLHRNYRSRPEIMRAARGLANWDLGLRPRSARRRGGRVDVATYRDEETEAAAVFESLCAYASRGRAEEVVVLSRVERNLALVEDHLVGAGLRYRVLGGQRALERCELQAALAYLRLTHNPRDLVALAVAAEAQRGVGEGALRRLRGHCERRGPTVVGGLCRADEVAGLSGGQRAGLRAIAEGVAAVAALAAGGGLVAACREALRRSGWPTRTAGLTPLERERARRRALVLWALAVAEERSGRATLAGLLERAALAGGDDEEDGTGAVTLATIHQAKGLEWPIVFAIGFTEGSLPHHRAIRPEEAEAIEGERRVAYVAMTRAREELHLSGSASLWGRPAGLSRFLAEARLAGAGAGAADGSTAAVAEEGSTRRLARRACSSASLTVRGAGKSGRLVRRRPRRSQ